MLLLPHPVRSVGTSPLLSVTLRKGLLRGGGGEVGGNAACAHPLSFQKMELALVPQSAHGSFYEGDCYIILSVSTIHHPTPPPFPHASPQSQALQKRNDAIQIPGVNLDSSSMLYRTGLQFDLKGCS